MSKKEKFLWVVQTGCLIRAIKDGWDMSLPMRIIAVATSIPEEVIPEDIDDAAFTFLQWQFKYGALGDQAKPPSWLIPLISDEAGETGYWKL
jgi:hypothetical protein